MSAYGSPGHRNAATVHALDRWRERMGFDLPRAEFNRMVRAIHDGHVPHVAITQTGAKVFHVRYAGTSGYAVWRHAVRTIATFYPSLDWVTNKGGTILRERVSA